MYILMYIKQFFFFFFFFFFFQMISSTYRIISVSKNIKIYKILFFMQTVSLELLIRAYYLPFFAFSKFLFIKNHILTYTAQKVEIFVYNCV